jgi:hypothetical protein
MKLGIPLLAATGLATLLNVSAVQAIPLYYSFEGTVASYPITDDTGFLADIGLGAGDSVSYTFMIDKSRQGTRLNEFGDVVEDEDAVYVSGSGRVTNYILHDSFYVELVQSSVFDLVQTHYPDRGSDEPWTGSGYANEVYRNGMLEQGYGEVSLHAGSSSIGTTGLYLYNDMSTWEIGSTVSADNSTSLIPDQPGDDSRFRSDLILTAVSTTNPATSVADSLLSGISDDVYGHSGAAGSDTNSGGGTDTASSGVGVPEPSTFLLLGAGLLSIGAGRLRKQSQS